MNSFGSNCTTACTGTHQEREFGATIAREFGLPSPVGEILFSRKIDTLAQAEEFLFPQLSMLPTPDRMKGMHEAVACIMAICETNQPIFIHGDYDVDGISATVLLVSFFKELGREVFFYIPNRLKESYGLSIESINRLVAKCPNRGGVLISADCGISAVREVAYARQQGLRVVITDHHEPRETVPDADAILNPKQPGCTFPCDALAGVGVAFYLTMALRKAMGIRLNLKQYLDLVALGTVADVVPLIGVNRIFVRAGLEVLSSKTRFGVLSLCECSGLDRRDVLSEDISFKLAPRINAAGRLGCPEAAVALLLAEDMERARQAADELDRLNTARKQLESRALVLVEGECRGQMEGGARGLTVYQPDCHVGVLGILASRLIDRYQRPAIVFADDLKCGVGEMIRGSGRSIRGINLFRAMEQCSRVIEQFGGHAMAVGLTLKRENLELFSRMFDAHIKQVYNELHENTQLVVDYHLRGNSLLSSGLARALQWLQPFGEGNPEPVFLLSGQKLLAPKTLNGHLVFQVQGEGQVFSGIGFHLARTPLDLTRPTNLVFQLKRSWFKGMERNQIYALSIIPH